MLNKTKKMETQQELERNLENLYTNLKATPSYGAKISKFLQTYDLHSRNKRITKKKFPRRKVIATHPFNLFMADLFMYPQYKYLNNRFQFVLLLIDCFTKKIYVRAMKRKTKEATAEAFEAIFRDFDQFPTMLVTDDGKGEFLYVFAFKLSQSSLILLCKKSWSHTTSITFQRRQNQNFCIIGRACNPNNKNSY